MSTESKWEIEYGDYPIAGRIEGDGFTVSIMYDDCPSSPREMGDCHVGHMLCAYPGYTLGDEQAPQPFDTSIECPVCEGSGYDDQWYVHVADEGEIAPATLNWFDTEEEADEYAATVTLGEGQSIVVSDTCLACEGEGSFAIGIYDFLKKTRGATVVLPLFVYEHSGITMSCGSNMGSTESRGRYPFDSAGWDTSMVGFIFDTPETRKTTGCEGEHIEAALRAEVDEYDSYLRGDVYGVVVDIPGIDNHMLNCWGFIGEKWAEEQAREMADEAEQIVAKERAERAEMAARDIATV